MNTVRFITERAERVFLEAHEAYMNKRLLYGRVNARFGSAPQNMHIPEGVAKGSFEHTLFLFFTTIITYASDSDMGFRQSVFLFENFRHLFTEGLTAMSIAEVGDCLRQAGFVRPQQGALYWHGSGTALFCEYQGEPLRFLDVRSVEEFLLKKETLRKRLRREALPGIGPKIFSLMSLFFEELGLISEMSGAFPVDLHVQRICISLGIIEGGGTVYAASLAEYLRPRIYDVCQRLEMKPIDLSHALWFLGNRVCTRCSLVEGIEHICPIVHFCGGAISSLIYSRKGKWNLDVPRLEKGSRQFSLFDHDTEVLLDAAERGRRVSRELKRK